MKKALLLLIVLSLMLVFVIGADSDGDGSGLVGVALFLAGPIFYGVVYAAYSGKYKRHDHEVATESQIDELLLYDNFALSVKGSKESSIGTVTYSNQYGAGNDKKNRTITEQAVKSLFKD